MVDGCTTSTNGRSGCRPCCTSSSAAATCAKVPPRCTVALRAQSAARHGIGPSSAQSTLNTPGPRRNRRQPPLVARREPAAGDRDQLGRRQVSEHRAARRQVVERCDGGVEDDVATPVDHDRGEGVGDGLGPARRDRPAHEVTQDPHEHARSRPWRHRAGRASSGRPSPRAAPGPRSESSLARASDHMDRIPAVANRVSGGSARGEGGESGDSVAATISSPWSTSGCMSRA